MQIHPESATDLWGDPTHSDTGISSACSILECPASYALLHFMH